MSRRGSRRLIVALAIAAWCAVHTAAASAASLPASAQIRIGPTIDIDAFKQIVASRYDVRFDAVVATDIDHDGDTDLVAATNGRVIVWVNDGIGHLTARSPNQSPTANGSAPGNAWEDRGARRDESIQNDLPAPRLPSPVAHAPPARARTSAFVFVATRHFDPARCCRSPRAPPL